MISSFDPKEEFSIEGHARLVIYDYVQNNYALIQEIAPGGEWRVPKSFFTHGRYKYKIQVIENGRWADLFKYSSIFLQF
jgi:hypothetical protein